MSMEPRSTPSRGRTVLLVALVLVVYAMARLGRRWVLTGGALIAVDAVAVALLVVVAWPFLRSKRRGPPAG